MIKQGCFSAAWQSSRAVQTVVLAALGMLLTVCLSGCSTKQEKAKVVVGSKAFTESVILGEMLSALGESAGAEAEHKRELGGTQFVWPALQSGEIDVYIEYTGTIRKEIFSDRSLPERPQMVDAMADEGVFVSQPLGFSNTYALGMRRQRAEELGISTIGDLAKFTDLKFGFSDEFIQREDGWLGLKRVYQLPHTNVRGMDHSLAYKGVVSGAIDVIDLYSTDAEKIAFDLVTLEDELEHFPKYEAVMLMRQEFKDQNPQVAESMLRVVGSIDEDQMTALNKEVRIDRDSERMAARAFLSQDIDSAIEASPDEHWAVVVFRRLLRNTKQHLELVVVSLFAAIVIAVPLGVLAYRKPKIGKWILAIVGVIQTIPSLALLVIMIPLIGLGFWPAVVALFLYSLLPIVRGTHTGLSGLSESIHESALALGLPSMARLRLIEMPLAIPSILSGIKTSAVINIGTATIGALIGAGGYGQPIFTGVRLDDRWLILQGAIPAALMAIAAQAAFGWIEKKLSGD